MGRDDLRGAVVDDADVLAVVGDVGALLGDGRARHAPQADGDRLAAPQAGRGDAIGQAHRDGVDQDPVPRAGVVVATLADLVAERVNLVGAHVVELFADGPVPLILGEDDPDALGLGALADDAADVLLVRLALLLLVVAAHHGVHQVVSDNVAVVELGGDEDLQRHPVGALRGSGHGGVPSFGTSRLLSGTGVVGRCGSVGQSSRPRQARIMSSNVLGTGEMS